MMGIIVCQDSNEIIDYFEADKVTVLYTTNCTISKEKHSEDK
jgi:SR1 protein